MDEAPSRWSQPAAFLGNQNDPAIYRGFSQLRSRLLIQTMTEVTEIEHKLNDLDRSDAGAEMLNRRFGSTEYDGWDAAQRDLLNQLREKMIEYG